MSLTNDWKAGELKNGWYFCKFENDAIFPALCFDNDFDDCQLRVVEVLAPCSYDELQRLKEKLDEAPGLGGYGHGQNRVVFPLYTYNYRCVMVGR